ncbi:MAG: hypothetical protein GWN48_04460, partial [Actinobacteria bacterium]|nr:hypothetical protein [Actinomycetota bacterium]
MERSGEGTFATRMTDGTTRDSDVVINVAGPHSAAVNRLAGVELPLETRALRREVHLLQNPRFEEGSSVSLPI